MGEKYDTMIPETGKEPGIMEERQKKQKMTKWRSLMVKIATIQFVQLIMLAGHVAAVVCALNTELFPGEEAIKSIVSSFSEILAGLYGTTLAGYTFFLSRIDALTASDSSLDFVVVNIKNRFKSLIYFITGHVIFTLFASLVLMYASMPQGDLWRFLYRLVCNEFAVNTVFSIVLILYYAVRVIDPNGLEREAKKQKEILSAPEGAQGSVTEFLALYSAIVTHCNARLPESVVQPIRRNKGDRFAYSIALMEEWEAEQKPLLEEITRIHHYYECMVNCSPMTVTQEMCLLARGVLTKLEEI